MAKKQEGKNEAPIFGFCVKADPKIFQLTPAQQREIERIKAWEQRSQEKNITLGGPVEF